MQVMEIGVGPNRWAVTDGAGQVVKNGFGSNAAAWSWIDRNSYTGRDDTDRHNRIRDSFNGSYEPLRY